MKTINIEGMSCNHCVMAVKKALTNLDRVNKVDVKLEEKKAFVEGDVDNNTLKEVIKDAGYKVTSIE
ncbi:MAG: heavy-metal-associated domain-containing protein [Firmicutes bacterium]|nr:heavy-metal-associated domain-containing protein [Bacillota bacterium]